jgi:hypothetical protein
MTGRTVAMTGVHVLILGFLSAVNPEVSLAQGVARVRVAVPTASVVESTSQRAATIMTAPGGTVFDVLARDGDWYWIMLPPDRNGTSRPGYIAVDNVEVMTGSQPVAGAPAVAAAPPSSARPAPPDVSPGMSRMRTSQPAIGEAERDGFTMLLDLGSGVQMVNGFENSERGLAGLNVGLGRFLTRDLALMFRFSGTTVFYEGTSLVSGVVGPIVQYWVSDRINLRVGGGLGFWSGNEVSDRAFGLIFGGGVTVFSRGKHTLQIGAEYSPAFTADKVHNLGFTFGYQLL